MTYEEVVGKHMLWMRRKAAWRLQDVGIFWVLGGVLVAVSALLPAAVTIVAGLLVALTPFLRLALATYKIRKYRKLGIALKALTEEVK